jgi:hypothetical protein
MGVGQHVAVLVEVSRIENAAAMIVVLAQTRD